LCFACAKCGVSLPETEFYKRRTGRLNAACKPCVRATSQARRDRLAEQGLRQKQTVYTAGERLRINQTSRLRRYGLSGCDFTRLRIEQSDRCAICSGPAAVTGKTPNIDHCHASGKVRGLLCTPCNLSLGYMRDDPDLLRAAALYLEETA
jgi:hypothetical protein